MNKTKTILAAGGAVSAILVVVAGVFVYNAFDEAESTNKSVRDNIDKLKRLYSKKLFPEPKNIEIEKANAEEYNRRFAELTNIVTRGAIPAESFSGGTFSTMLGDRLKVLRGKAPRDADGNTVVGDTFNFGFDERMKGVHPHERQVPRLMKQLKLVEKLTDELYKAGVVSIEKINREEFEIADSSESQSSGGGGGVRVRGGRTGSGSGSGGNFTLGSVVSEKVEGVPAGVSVSRERFGFQFTTYESGLVDILNRLNKFEPFVMVNDIGFIKKTPLGDVVFPVIPAAAAKAPADPAVPVPPVIAVRFPDISGPVREVPVSVTLVVDVYDFADNQK